MTSTSLVGKMLLGRYRVVRPLGQGGMGVVYLARVEGAAGFAIPVVVKTISPHLTADPTTEKLFVREARILSYLKHPNIVGVVDFGQTPSGYVLVLEYVHGYHVGQWLKTLRLSKRAFPVDNAIHLIVQVLEALHYAHTLKRPDGSDLAVVHRDVSPANILIDSAGNVKLYDFGIARMLEDAGEYRTQEGVVKGTMAFSAPEVLQGLGASPVSDVYACAVILYQLLSGKNPFTGKELRETLHRVLTLDPPLVHEVRKEVPVELSRVLNQALSKEPNERQASAAVFAQELRALLTQPEDMVATAFAAHVQADFSTDVPKLLDLESLEVRDAAWRATALSNQSAPPSLRPSLLAPRDSLPPTRQEFLPLAVATGDQTTLRATRPSRSLLVLALSLSFVAVSIIVAVLVLRTPPASSSESRFLLIEKRVPVDVPSAAANETIAANEPAIDAPKGAPNLAASERGALTDSTKVATRTPNAPPLSAALSATFQRQQPKIEQCFERFTQDVEGHPQVSVFFKVKNDGSVETANLNPAQLANSKLGQCVLQIARTTRFQTLTEPVSFSIPITARRVAR